MDFWYTNVLKWVHKRIDIETDRLGKKQVHKRIDMGI